MNDKNKFAVGLTIGFLCFFVVGATIIETDTARRILKIIFGAPITLTISGGSVTPTQTNHIVATEGAAAIDDLSTLDTSNAIDGMSVYLTQSSTDSDIVIKDGTGNIVTGIGDYTLDAGQTVQLIYQSSTGNFSMVGTGSQSDMKKSTYDVDTNNAIDAASGGTNQDFSASTGVPTVDAGVFSVEAQLDSDKGGFGADVSAYTGFPYFTSGVPSAVNNIDADTYTLSNIDNSEIKADAGIEPYKIAMLEIATATYDDLGDWWSKTQAAGVISGGTISDDGDGTITVAAGTGVIKTTDSPIGENKFFDWSASTALSLTDNDENYIYIDYNSGSPILGASISNQSNGRTIFNIGRVYKEGTTLHILNAGQNINEQQKKVLRRLSDVYGMVVRASGGVTGETGTRNITVSAAVLYAGLEMQTTDAFDSSGTDRFSYYYRASPSGWTKVTDQSQINNLNYDDGDGTLGELAPTQYGLHWVYLHNDGDVDVVYGRDSYTLAEAIAEQPPATLPDVLSSFSLLSAKIIIQKSAASFTDIESAFDTSFSSNVASDHNDLGGLQGGAAGEHYHLNSTNNTTYTTGAAGDIYYHSALNTPAKLTIGTPRQVLQTNSGGTLPEWTSSLSLSTATISSSVSCDSYFATGDLTIASTGAGINIDLHSDAGDDLLVDTDKLVVEGDTGYLGAGTVMPSAKLHIKQSADDHTGGVKFERTGAGTGTYSINGEDFLAIGYAANSTAVPTTSVAVDSTGKVGITTESPTATLHIKQSADDHTGGVKLERTGVGTGTYSVYGGDSLIVGYAANSVAVPTSLVTVDSTGDVGISTATISGSVSCDSYFAAGDITIASTGAGVNIDLHSDAGDDLLVDTDKFVVKGETGYVGVGTAGPLFPFSVAYAGSGTQALFGQGKTTGISYIAIGEEVVSDKSGTIGYDHDNNKLGLHILGETFGDGITIINGGNVGIGTASPATKLDVSGAITVTAGSGIQWGNGTGDAIYVASSDLRIYSAATLQLNTTTGLSIANLQTISGQSDVQYNTSTAALGYVSSSLKFKENVRDLADSDTAFIFDLKPKKYDRKDGTAVDEIGMIAEEVELVNPKLACKNADGETVTYSRSELIVPLLFEVQKLRNELNALKLEVEQLKNK